MSFNTATNALRRNVPRYLEILPLLPQKQLGLSDYPVVIRQQKTVLNLGLEPPFKHQRYLARVVNWWVLNGGGNTPKEAIGELDVHFEEMKSNREREGKPLPRPGTRVPIEFAPTEEVDADQDLKDDFIRRGTRA